MKIRISKKEWEVAGNKKGWLKLIGQTQAPVKTTPVKTNTPPKPDNTPRSPFHPPRPNVMPNPKAKIKTMEDKALLSSIRSFERILKCAQNYQRESHPSVRSFWGNIPKEHSFSEHPVLSKHGPKLSEEGFEFTRNKLSEGGKQAPSQVSQIMTEVFSILPKIYELEATHEEELVEMAKDITAQIWGIDRSMLDGQINQKQEAMEQEEPEQHNLVEMTPELKEQVNKRITMNVLTQGAAVHGMASVHHLVAEKLRQISPELLDLYTRISGLITNHYYAMDIPVIVKAVENLSQAGVGWSKIEYPKQEEGNMAQPEQPAQSEPKVVARGICFPVLCQEMFKGVMELLSLHGLPQNLSSDELYTVYQYADKLEDEPWQITVGPALWRKVLSTVPKDVPLSELVMKLSMKDPKEMHNIVLNIIEHPEAAKQQMEELTKPEPEEKEEEYVEEKAAGELVVPEETFEGLEDIFQDKEPKPKSNKDKGAGELVVPEETFEGLDDIFENKEIKGKPETLHKQKIKKDKKWTAPNNLEGLVFNKNTKPGLKK